MRQLDELDKFLLVAICLGGILFFGIMWEMHAAQSCTDACQPMAGARVERQCWCYKDRDTLVRRPLEDKE